MLGREHDVQHRRQKFSTSLGSIRLEEIGPWLLDMSHGGISIKRTGKHRGNELRYSDSNGCEFFPTCHVTARHASEANLAIAKDVGCPKGKYRLGLKSVLRKVEMYRREDDKAGQL